VVAERGSGHDLKQLFAQAADGEVALDPAPAVEHLRVGDRPDVAGDAVVAQRLQQTGGAGSGYLELGEGGLVEQPGRLPGGTVLNLDRR